ncbi:MAG: DUF255 domain-containing protein [Thiolinea sp.]
MNPHPSFFRYLFPAIFVCLGYSWSLPGSADHNGFKDHPSPYLQQHAEDAVHWQLLNNDVFTHALKQDKLLFISSGYAACYWCHRMREDTFANPAIGELINRHFVAILLDRELEPELDHWLQGFMEQQRGFGGWPVSVILTPDGKPLASFSYTPQAEFQGTLQRFLQDWTDKRPALQQRAEQNYQRLSEQNTLPETPEKTNLQSWLGAFLEQVNKLADEDYGGFGDQEKFPYLPQLAALLTLQQINPDPAVKTFLDTSFAAMIGGGLRDHLGGGFFRYTDDRDWTSPHYEQMLYTQALIAPLMLRFGTEYKQPVYVRTGQETLLAMIGNFQREDGLFRASLFATDDSGKQGGYYLWQAKELQQILGVDAGRVLNLFDVQDEDAPVLPFIMAQGEAAQTIRQRLLAEREQRTLQSDDKALLGWNALALSALAAGYGLDEQIQQAGAKLAAPLLKLAEHRHYPRLLGEQGYAEATLADQVYLAQGLADWGQVVQDQRYREAARDLVMVIYKQYYTQGWQVLRDNPLVGNLQRALIADTQLPSPSALWLKLAWELGDAGSELQRQAEQVAAVLPQDLQVQAFFHATHTAVLVAQRYQQLQQPQSQSRPGGEGQ